MNKQPIRSVVILGGGTAGWMAAAAAGRFLDDGQRTVTLVESDAIATIGVGEATIPPIAGFNRLLGIDEATFVAATGATFKLGIEFVNWARRGDRYFHPFGTAGRDFEGVAFHQFWLRYRDRAGIGDWQRYAMSTAAAGLDRFAPPADDPRSLRHQLAYAYHFDATRYAAFLRARAEADGVTRIEGKVARVERDPATGHVTALLLDDERRIAGDLFFDCSGFRALLIGDTLGVPYVDWSHWLPCDHALAVASTRTAPLHPFTRATAHDAGWQWRIPLQHRTGNGHVHASAFVDEDTATATLLATLDGTPETPRSIRFRAGRRERQWVGNVVALGLAAGFVEPLESTSIHLIQTAISKLFWLFPDRGFSAVEQEEFNRMMNEQYDYVRDFIILHYKATERVDTPFWRYVSDMPIPDSLAHKIELFREKGRVKRHDHDLFDVPSWVAVMLGQRIVPEGYDTLVDALDEDRVLGAMQALAQGYAREAAAMPTHEEYVARLAPRG